MVNQGIFRRTVATSGRERYELSRLLRARADSTSSTSPVMVDAPSTNRIWSARFTVVNSTPKGQGTVGENQKETTSETTEVKTSQTTEKVGEAKHDPENTAAKGDREAEGSGR